MISPAATSSPAARWSRICAFDDILPDSGVAALIGGRQVAIFRVRDAVHALGNQDPASGANVLSRGIVGDLGGELVVASPLYKQHYSLISGCCLEEPAWQVPVFPIRIYDGQIWVRDQPVAGSGRAHAGKRRLIVVGNDAAAHRAIEELRRLAPGAYDITVFDNLEDPIALIDRVRRRVRSQAGVEASYDRLLIATGSVPVALPVPGHDLPGVLDVAELQDPQRLLEAARAHRQVVIIGGSAAGVQLAHALQAHGLQVTLVDDGPHLLEQQLDAQAAALLHGSLEAAGVRLRMRSQTLAILGNTRASGVRLDDGELAADLVVTALGAHPNIELARAAGLPCERGVIVDDTLATFDPSIYAVGECVQHRHRTLGLSTSLAEQARVCAAHLANRGVRRYRGAPAAVQLKLGELEVFSAGEPAADSEDEALVLRDPIRGIYKRLVLHRNRLRAAVLYGDTRDSGWYCELIHERRDVTQLRDELLFGADSDPQRRAAR